MSAARVAATPYLIPEVHTPKFITRTANDLTRQNVAMQHEPLLGELYRAESQVDRVLALAKLLQNYSAAFSTVHGGPVPPLSPMVKFAIPDSDRRTEDELTQSGCLNPGSCAHGDLCAACWPIYVFTKFIDVAVGYRASTDNQTDILGAATRATVRARLADIFRVGSYPAAPIRNRSRPITRALIESTPTNPLTNRYDLRAFDADDERKSTPLAGADVEVFPDHPLPTDLVKQLIRQTSICGVVVSPSQKTGALALFKTLLHSSFNLGLALTKPYHGSAPAVVFPGLVQPCKLAPVTTLASTEGIVAWAKHHGHLDAANAHRCYYCSAVDAFMMCARGIMPTDEFETSSSHLLVECRNLLHPMRHDIAKRKNEKLQITTATTTAPRAPVAVMPRAKPEEPLVLISAKEFDAMSLLTQKRIKGRPSNADAKRLNDAAEAFREVKNRFASERKPPAAAAAAAAAAVTTDVIPVAQTAKSDDTETDTEPPTPSSASDQSDREETRRRRRRRPHTPDQPTSESAAAGSDDADDAPAKKRARLTADDEGRLLSMRYRAIAMEMLEETEHAPDTADDAKRRDSFWRAAAAKKIGSGASELVGEFAQMVKPTTNFFTLFNPDVFQSITSKQSDPLAAGAALLTLRANLGRQWFCSPSFVNVSAAMKSLTTARMVINAMEALETSASGSLKVDPERAFQLLSDSQVALGESHRANDMNALRWLAVSACAYICYKLYMEKYNCTEAVAIECVTQAINTARKARPAAAAASAAAATDEAPKAKSSERTATKTMLNAGRTVAFAPAFMFVDINHNGQCSMDDFRRLFFVSMDSKHKDTPRLHLEALKSAAISMFDTFWSNASHVMAQYRAVAPQFITLIRGATGQAARSSPPAAAAAAAAAAETGCDSPPDSTVCPFEYPDFLA
jgi:PHD/YefM family antitoxin component YafN of YafNO toxin-antitoxin module